MRALQGVARTAEVNARLEEWIASTRGVAFEADAPLHNIFSEDAKGLDSMHCAELTTETLKVRTPGATRVAAAWVVRTCLSSGGE